MPQIVANTRLPTEKANGYQTMKTAEALARIDSPVVLWTPIRFRSPEVRGVGDPFTYYGVERGFRLRRLPSIDLVTPLGRNLPPLLSKIVFLLQALSFSVAACVAAAFSRDRTWYSRDVYFFLLFAPFARFLGKRVHLEAHHALPRLGGWRRRALASASSIVAITRGLADELVAAGALPDRVLVLPDAVEEARLGPHPAQTEARQELDLPPEVPLVVYTGHLYPWKGVDTLIASAANIPNVQFLLVGGTQEDLARHRRRLVEDRIENVRLVGHRPPADVPLYLAAADCLVLPNTARRAISARYTSPLKLFEYLAANRPIVASDLPSLREILTDGETALLVPPDNPSALAAGIRQILADRDRGRELATRGHHLARQHTWRKRADRLKEWLDRA